MDARKPGWLLVPLLAGVLAGGALGHSVEGYPAMRPGMMGCGHGPMMGYGSMHPGSGMGMGPGMAMGSAQELTPEQLDLIGEHMLLMHAQMQKIADAKDPETRRAAVREHLHNMQAFQQQRHELMMRRFAQGQTHWQNRMEQRLRRMEQMLKQQQ